MNSPKHQKVNLFLDKLQLLSYVILGITVFSLTSLADFNYFLRSYLVFLEAGIGFMLIYFFFIKLAKVNKKKL